MKYVLQIIFTLVFATSQAFADGGLYSGTVVVTDQGEAERNDAIPQALIQVLRKLSGRRELPLSTALDDALANANGLSLSIRYQNVERLDPEGVASSQLQLIVRFRQAAVDALLQEVSLPRWQQERPAVQIWVVIEDGLSRELKPVEFDYAWLAMEELAATRGLPLSWPELDEEELQLIDMRLVWGGFTDYLVERGAPGDGLVIIAARREGPEWTLRWNLASNEQHWSWRNSDQELMFALAAGVHQMTEKIAAVNAIAISEQGQNSVEITIGGLYGANDYVRCLGYLQQLSLVTAVEILAAQPGRVHFQLQLNASTEYLTESFNRGTVLSPSHLGSEYDYELLPE